MVGMSNRAARLPPRDVEPLLNQKTQRYDGLHLRQRKKRAVVGMLVQRTGALCKLYLHWAQNYHLHAGEPFATRVSRHHPTKRIYPWPCAPGQGSPASV